MQRIRGFGDYTLYKSAFYLRDFCSVYEASCLPMFQVHVVVEEQGSRGDDVDQGPGSGQRRRHGRPVLPGEQSSQRPLHLPRPIGCQPAAPRPSPAHRRELRSLRRAATHLRRARDSLGLRRTL